MSPNKDNNNKLISWKEISKYLDCEVRTCQRLEKEGLPIRRFSSSPKSRVFAYINEIEDWLKNCGNNISIPNKNTSYNRTYTKIFYMLVFFFIMFGVYVVFLKAPFPKEPIDFKIIGKNLIITNEKNKELWRHEIELEGLSNEDKYRRHFQYKKKPIVKDEGMGRILPYLVIADINNDEHNEVLFALNTNNQYGGNTLYCFDRKGRFLWEFKGGRRIKFGNETFDDFVIRGFNIEDFTNAGSFNITIISNAVGRFPTQLCILDQNGKIVGEYWNAGHLIDFATSDLNDDGVKELYVVGMNNEYKKGCLIIFDPSNIRGGSPQNNSRQICKGLEKGTEKYYLTFPRTDFDMIKTEMEAIGLIDILKNKELSLEAATSRIIFKLDTSIKLSSIILGNAFKTMYSASYRKGELNGVLDQQHIKHVLKNILYYNGKNWVSDPSMSNPW